MPNFGIGDRLDRVCPSLAFLATVFFIAQCRKYQLTIALIVFPQAFNFIKQLDEVAFAFVFDA